MEHSEAAEWYWKYLKTNNGLEAFSDFTNQNKGGNPRIHENVSEVNQSSVWGYEASHNT